LGYKAELTGAAALVMENFEKEDVRNLNYENKPDVFI
jgi:hypothetical protein